MNKPQCDNKCSKTERQAIRGMKVSSLIPLLLLWVFVPSVAHAGRFALFLYPTGALTGIISASFLFAGGRRMSLRVVAAMLATLTAACVFLLPSEFFSSKPFQFLASWLGEWAFFLLGFIPTALMVLLVLWLGARLPSRKNT